MTQWMMYQVRDTKKVEFDETLFPSNEFTDKVDDYSTTVTIKKIEKETFKRRVKVIKRTLKKLFRSVE